MDKVKSRTEHDSLGDREVPSEAYFGIQTLRAVENFPVSGYHEDPVFIKAYGRIKKAACKVNHKLGRIDDERARAIDQAAGEVVEGQFNDQFVVDVFQAGAGTSFHMNVNEVIANRALEILGKERGNYKYVSPNDLVNHGQSTNDTFPTAIHLAVLELWQDLRPILESLAGSFEERGKKFHHILKSGRTHLQDAVPVRLGQEFRAYGQAIKRSIRIMESAANELLELPIGGTAGGTGLNAPEGYQAEVVKELSKITGLEFRAAPDLREAMQSRQGLGAMSAGLRSLSLELIRIANDLRLLTSGPATGLAEIVLPTVQPGSSIMPAKVNPVMAECLNMICFQIIGNDTAMTMAIQAGQLELNVMMPLMVHNLLQSFRMLINYLPVFIEKCVAGITANEKRCNDYMHRSAALGTVLNPQIGYLKTAKLIKEALAKGESIRDLVIEKNILPSEKMDDLLDPIKLTGEK
ncbi:MAG: aspartate ammonia-lyase [Calditrichia bacterium]